MPRTTINVTMPKALLALPWKSRKARRLKEIFLAPRRTAANVPPGEVDMVAVIGQDFGCVQSGDSRPVREKLASLGRAIDR